MSADQTIAGTPANGGNQAQLTALLSPYTVTSSDSTGIQLINCKLNGDNYLTWSRLMRIALRAKNKIGFIDGTLPEPGEGDPNRALWVMANSTVVTWIANTLEKDLQPSIACIENARVIWDDLKQRFSQVTVAHSAIIAIDWVTREIPVGNSMGDWLLETIDRLQLEDNLRRRTLIPGKDKEETGRIEVGRIGHIGTEQGGSPRNQLGRAV
ncbi:hypothetical protein CRG98_019415 [Punica granatum]|uniref:Retrotransposon Copia-like N-terminal domain-containing protein n=1 Tax=Punica granatum TaxID=22663 RepID=A0A2I0JV84_PUNGR|nr:hypothetical protein CRG98_019415 [Punica granatum]